MTKSTLPHDDDDNSDDWTICDRCGYEVTTIYVSAGREDWHDWQGATLCSDCWAEVEDEERDRDQLRRNFRAAGERLAGGEMIAWQDLRVIGGRLSVNQSGQIELSIETDGPALFAVLDPDHTCNFGWSPADWPFNPNRTEE